MKMKQINAIIQEAELVFEYDNRFLCLNLWLRANNYNWKFGGINLGNRFKKKFDPRGGEHAFWWIKRVFDVADVESMSELAGKAVRLRINDDNKIEAIGHIVKEDWFCPDGDFKNSDFAHYCAGEKDVTKDLPMWRTWRNGACGNGIGIPIAIVKQYGGGYKLVDSLGIEGETYIMLSDLEKLPKEERNGV